VLVDAVRSWPGPLAGFGEGPTWRPGPGALSGPVRESDQTGRLSGTCRVWYDFDRPYGSHDPQKSCQTRSGSGIRGFGTTRVGRTR